MAKYFTLILFFITSLCFAQRKTGEVVIPKGMSDESRDSTYYKTYQKLKQLAITRIHKPSHQITNQLISNFKQKIRFADGTYPDNIARDYSTVLKWLKDGNLQKTKFKNYEEAEAEFKKIISAARQEDIEDPEYAQFRVEAIMKYGPQIFIDLVQEMMMEYPDLY